MRGWIVKMDREFTRRRGSMLILALAVLALLVSFVMHAQVKAHARQQGTNSSLDRLRLRLAVTDAVIHALQVLADDEDLLVDHLGEPWAKPIDIETPDGIGIVITFKDAQRRFDLNNLYSGEAPPEGRDAEDVLGDLFTYCGDYRPGQRIRALADWVDPDDDGVLEAPAYRDAGLEYPPADRMLLSMSETLAVLHYDREFFRRREFKRRGNAFQSNILDEVSVIAAARTEPVPVNINTCGISVLRALVGLAETATAETVLVAREEQPIRSLAPFGVVLAPLLQKTLQRFADVRSEYFEVHANAYLNGASVRMTGLARRGGDGSVRIVKWVM